MVMLGNLTIEEMEHRAGFEFPQELIDYMKERHQSKAENIAPGKWHCFDIPFSLVCGDMEVAQTIHDHLLPFGKKFNEPMHIGTNATTPER